MKSNIEDDLRPEYDLKALRVRRVGAERMKRVDQFSSSLYNDRMIAQFPRVMTLDETAQYLRLPSTMIEQQAVYGQIPGRKIENTWRFLREALDDWLRAQDSRVILLQQAGALADDDHIDTLLDEIYAERGRSEIDQRVSGGHELNTV